MRATVMLTDSDGKPVEVPLTVAGRCLVADDDGTMSRYWLKMKIREALGALGFKVRLYDGRVVLEDVSDERQ